MTENGGETFSDVDDDEIDCYLFKNNDKPTKSKLWHHYNKEWIDERAAKEQQMRVRLFPFASFYYADPVAQELLENGGKAPRRSRKRLEATSAAEAAQHVMDKKLTTKSSRINWEALQVKGLLDRLEESGIEVPPFNSLIFFSNLVDIDLFFQERPSIPAPGEPNNNIYDDDSYAVYQQLDKRPAHPPAAPSSTATLLDEDVLGFL